LYVDCILNGQLKNEFKDFRSFYLSLISSNRFLFPAMNGEQHANHKVTKVLLEASLNFVNRKLKEKEEDYE